MKKVLFTLAVLLVGMTAAAQTWKQEHRAADPMKELPQHNVYTYQIDSITYFEICDSTLEWKLVRDMNHDAFKFKQYERSNHFKPQRVKIDAELLDKQKNVIGQMYKKMVVTSSLAACAIGSGKYTKGEDIPRHLLNGVGYVHIIAPLYSGGEVDVTIPCIH